MTLEIRESYQHMRVFSLPTNLPTLSIDPLNEASWHNLGYLWNEENEVSTSIVLHPYKCVYVCMREIPICKKNSTVLAPNRRFNSHHFVEVVLIKWNYYEELSLSYVFVSFASYTKPGSGAAREKEIRNCWHAILFSIVNEISPNEHKVAQRTYLYVKISVHICSLYNSITCPHCHVCMCLCEYGHSLSCVAHYSNQHF